LPRTRMGDGQIDQLENFRAAGLINLDSLHVRVRMNPEGGMGQEQRPGFRDQGSGINVNKLLEPA
jgi:hypothetical protein